MFTVIVRPILDALGNDGWFYREPLSVGIRYGKQPLGINTLEGLMKEMCQKAGLMCNYTNHSGKRTCATRMDLMSSPLWTGLATGPPQSEGINPKQMKWNKKF